MTDLQQTAEPVCPACKAALLYECVACSKNNYPPQQDGLAQPKQEPVAYCYVAKKTSADALTFNPDPANAVDNTVFPLYALPPQRPWQGLTDEEIRALASWWPSYDQMPALMVLAKDIQNLLKERNNG